MEMAKTVAVEAARRVSPCPWCGSAAKVELQSNGMGQTAMHCTGCGASGPDAPLTIGFEDANARATALWCGRRSGRPVARETLDRVGKAVRLHCLTGRPDPHAMIGITWGDLDILLRSVVPAETPGAA